MMQSVELQPSPRESVPSPTGIVLSGTQKSLLLVIVLGALYLRLYLRKRRRDKICPHCGHRNPHHRNNCEQCSAPLFMPQ